MNWQGLHIRLSLTVAAGALVIALVSSLFAYQRGFNQSLEDSERSVRQLMTTVQISAAIAVYVHNPELGGEVVRGLMNNDIVSAAQLRGLDQSLVHAGQPITDNAAVISLTLNSPLDENEAIGQLRVHPNRTLIQTRARSEAIAIVTQLVGQTVLVAAIVMVAVYLILTRPLTKLSSDLHNIKPGSTQRLAMPADHQLDEIGRLTGDINNLLDTVTDILTEERQLRERVESLEQRFRGIFEDSSAGIFLLNADGSLSTANHAFLRAIGHADLDSVKQLGTRFIDTVFVDAAEAQRIINAAIDSGRPCSADLQYHVLGDHVFRWAHCVISASANDNIRAVEGVLYDITERRNAEELNRQQAETDTLTGIHNRRYIEQMMEQLTTASQRNSFAILLCDLDRFKHINDCYGHDAGDTVLRVVANRLRLAVRDQDVVARLGGDEFLILLNHMNNDSAIQRIAKLLLNSVTQPIELSNTQLETVGISIGIAYYPSHGTSTHELTRHADAAMYHVKRDGRNGFAIWHESDIKVTHLDTVL